MWCPNSWATMYSSARGVSVAPKDLSISEKKLMSRYTVWSPEQ